MFADAMRRCDRGEGQRQGSGRNARLVANKVVEDFDRNDGICDDY